jgi:hypothetical protein
MTRRPSLSKRQTIAMVPSVVSQPTSQPDIASFVALTNCLSSIGLTRDDRAVLCARFGR